MPRIVICQKCLDAHWEDRSCSCGSESDLSVGLVGKQVLNALKLTYRKHCLADDSIGWIELEDILRDALCETMGDREFQLWLNEVAD